MGKLDPLAGTSENHSGLANHVAAPQRRKTDIALPPRPHVAVPGAHALFPKQDIPPLGGGRPKHERGARWRVTLVAVMHLEDLDVELGPQSLRDALGKDREQVDAKAHIAGLD